ncbi:bifunctional cytochrome P450/NADPH--P450 reductase [Paenibacillus thiaminolyticus]|uniref:bifunctional cytochrome P450/NADPH--P450 reductase n=1 Tax=Paenibacillus thiaminolyticus TaxID=49283 RepID=UPI001164EC28|nr:bifunctional cytochrome P450/NADPH--P450 reductase [Paenibacillus thiaminolyticus]NGP60472.1 cytochrome P450 [Paenibacillus thiaminolyticus]WCR25890.1 bifunctional cytochrome P450/NADPH--P450 reductase [Paenibacillus thiaminolyticus]
MEELMPIPQPKTYGVLGNLPLIDKDSPTLSFGKLADEYGPIFRFELMGRSVIIVSGPEFVAEVCDQSRFDKAIGHLLKVRDFAGDGLFTSLTDEPNWPKAHNILMPSFSLQAMKGYHDRMLDIALQLVQKWARLNPDESIDVADDMTRLTLDTIGLCGFDYRFNSYYRETPNPFIVSMVRALDEAMHYGSRLPIQNKLMLISKRQYERDIQSMFSLVDKIIAERKASGDQGGTDLLARMLTAKDPETGQQLDDQNIRYQIITFLIAGHETTSGLLSFAIYFLLKHPEVLEKAYREVDEVLTGPLPTYEQVLKLKYVRMILNESLRLWPTAPQFSLFAKEDTVIGGKYPIQKGEAVSIIIPKLHRDKGAWGEDAELFRPERFEDPAKVPNHAYKPFGNGQRACIGMQFALHEATLVLGLILQQFELMDHLNYQLKVKQTLTLKPADFKIRVQLRDKKFINPYPVPPVDTLGDAPVLENKRETASIIGVNNRPLLVLYGSDMGTAERIAKELADLARLHGIRSEAATLNERLGNLPQEGALIIITSSYNGKPPNNAKQFVQWLELVEPGELRGVRYAVFGCGDHNWAATYQAVPRFIDEQLAQKGATRFSPRGEADASGDFEKQLEAWKSQMWADAIKTFDLKLNENAEKERSTLSIQFVSGMTETPLAQSYEAVRSTIAANRELQQPGSERSTRHIEIELPEGMTYQEGDHLGVFPSNRKDHIDRILRRFSLREKDQVILTASGVSATHLPLDRPISLLDLLSQSVEVQEAATRAQIREVAAFTVCPPHKRELEALLEEGTYEEQILKKRVTMLDLVEKYEACEIPFEKFVELLPPLKPRYYSISSSPRMNHARASITVGVVRGQAWSGRGEYLGVASNYLAERRPGDDIVMFVRTPDSGFQLPEDPQTPIIMVGPGTGVAPFRGFLQARAAMKREGQALGEAHLYFGCRNEADFLYREELEQYDRDGVVTLHTAFSRKEGVPKTYVQHLMANNAPEILRILDGEGRLYVCGDGSKMAPDVEHELKKAYQVIHGGREQEADKWLENLQTSGRYAKDVWAGL